MQKIYLTCTSVKKMFIKILKLNNYFVKNKNEKYYGQKKSFKSIEWIKFVMVFAIAF